MKVVNINGSEFLILGDNEYKPFGYIGETINVSKIKYDEYKSNYMNTTTSKYPDCLPMNYHHWYLAQVGV